MIIKHVAMKTVQKSSFVELTKYITSSQDKQERVGVVSVTNCRQQDPLDAALEVYATQAQNKRATSDKTYHIIISFRAGEHPSEVALKEIEQKVCAGLGFSEHQRISAVHHDTDNLHIHVAINKIHPTKLTIHTPYFDHLKFGPMCEALEAEYGLQRDNHKVKKTSSEGRAADMENMAGIESLMSWVKRECAPELRQAKNWSEFNQVLEKNGLEIKKRGNGFIVTNADGIAVKASSIARDFSKDNLEAKLGTFEPGHGISTSGEALGNSRIAPDVITSPGSAPSSKTPLPGVSPSTEKEQPKSRKPVRKNPVGKLGKSPPPAGLRRPELLSGLGGLTIDNGNRYEQKPVNNGYDSSDLFSRYQSSQSSAIKNRVQGIAAARATRFKALDDVKRSAKRKRAAIKLLGESPVVKRALYAMVHRKLLADIKKIRSEYADSTAAIAESGQRHSWNDWLQVQAKNGDNGALAALRARDKKRGKQQASSHPIKPTVTSREKPLRPDGVTKKGTVIYRDGSTSIRDDGIRLKIAGASETNELQAALKMAMEKYGKNLKVNGSAKFKSQIVEAAVAARINVTFDDNALEQRRQALLSNLNQQEKINVNQPIRDPSGRFGKHAVEPGQHRAGETLTRLGQHIGPTRQPVAGRPGYAGSAASRSPFKSAKPGVGKVGSFPPPPDRKRVRNLSQLGVVHIASGSESVLPGHVPAFLDNQGQQQHHGLRRDLLGAGRIDALNGIERDKYTAELRAAIVKHGAVLKVNGTDEYKQIIVQVAAEARIEVTFDDAVLEQRRRALLDTTTQPQAGAGARNDTAEGRATTKSKPGVGKVGAFPPPPDRKRFRNLSQLGVVHIDNGPEAVPPSRINTPTKNKDMATSHADKTTLPKTGIPAITGVAAADKYVAEREAKRIQGFDISKHTRYNGESIRAATYGGLRTVDGQALALVKESDRILVMPIDDTTAQLLGRTKLGEPLTVNRDGSIKKRGRSR